MRESRYQRISKLRDKATSIRDALAEQELGHSKSISMLAEVVRDLVTEVISLQDGLDVVEEQVNDHKHE